MESYCFNKPASNTNFPCLNCKKRHDICWSTCEDYNRAKKQQEKEESERRKYLDDFYKRF